MTQISMSRRKFISEFIIIKVALEQDGGSLFKTIQGVFMASNISCPESIFNYLYIA